MRSDEVVVAEWREHWVLMTMPIGTYRISRRRWNIEAIGEPALWQPLIDELAAEADRILKQHNAWREEALAAGYRVPKGLLQQALEPLDPRLDGDVREYICTQCGEPYLGLEYHRAKRLAGRLCSRECERKRALGQQREWRAAHPEALARSNASRTWKRASARAGRNCEHCGTPIEAARSTRRFCSSLCRIRAYHHRSANG